MKVLARVCVGVMVATMIAGCASKSAYVPKIPPGVQAHISEYNEKPGNKVFIVAVDPSGNYAFGYGHSKGSVEEAAKIAVEQCDASREAYGVAAKPYVYAVNDRVVYEAMVQSAADAETDKESRAAQKELAEEEGLLDGEAAPAE